MRFTNIGMHHILYLLQTSSYSVPVILLNFFVVITADGAYQNDSQQEGNNLCVCMAKRKMFSKQCAINVVHMSKEVCITCMAATAAPTPPIIPRFFLSRLVTEASQGYITGETTATKKTYESPLQLCTERYIMLPTCNTIDLEIFV